MTIELLNDSNGTSTFGEWNRSEKYRCQVLVVREDDGSYSSIVVNLPGVGSCGDTEEDALANVREAVGAAIESYKEAGKDIPWTDVDGASIPSNAKQKWILVDA